MKLFCETSSIFELDIIENAAILRDFLNFWTWQRQKRSYSARLPQFFKLTTSKTKQFCETSFNNGKLNAELTAWCQCVLRFFYSMSLKYCACHEKVRPGHTKCCTCHQSWRSHAPKCNPSQEISTPTHLTHVSLVLRLRREMHLSRSSSNVPCLPSFLKLLQNPHVLLTFDQVHNPLCLPRRTTSERPKALRNPKFLHFYFEMCFAPQRGTLFRHVNFQKWSEHGVLCTFWLGNALRATMACTFSTSQLPKMVM